MPCSMPAALCILCLLYQITPGIQEGEDKLQYVSQYISAHSMFTVTQSSERRCLSEHVPIIKKLVTNSLDLLKPSLTLCTGFLLVTSRPFCLYILRQDQSLLYRDMVATSPKSDSLFSARRGREPCAGHHLHRVCVLLPRLPSDQSTSGE